MPAVNVVRTSWGRNTSAGCMGIQVDKDAAVYTLYTTPAQGTYTAGASDIQTTDRPGFHPLTSPKGRGLRSYQFEHRIFHPNPTGNVEAEVKWLERTASLGKRVRFHNTSGLATDRWYWVQECKVTEEEKGAGHKVRSALISWTLIEATTVNPVDWTKTAFKEQPPIKIEANGPEQAATSSDPVKNDKEAGDPAGTDTGVVKPPSGGAYSRPSAM